MQQIVTPSAVMHSKSKDPRRFTLACVISDDMLNIGYSICSNRDQFSKKKGRMIATGRAIKRPIISMPASKDNDENKKMFKQIFNEFPKREKDLFIKPTH